MQLISAPKCQRRGRPATQAPKTLQNPARLDREGKGRRGKGVERALRKNAIIIKLSDDCNVGNKGATKSGTTHHTASRDLLIFLQGPRELIRLESARREHRGEIEISSSKIVNALHRRRERESVASSHIKRLRRLPVRLILSSALIVTSERERAN